MCGITGLVFRDPDRPVDPARLRAMADTIRHRGPDDEGFHVDGAVGLAHRRLSILDLSPNGHQPMPNEDGSVWIAFNGEVYNFTELREDLEPRGHRFRGHSDTEVMLAAFEEWGVEQSLPRFIGMFAFAVWDARDRVLHLVRDRLGVKPLYYGVPGRDEAHGDHEIRVPPVATLAFASELKAIHAMPGFSASIDRRSLAAFMRYGYVPDPRSIWTGIRKLPPGTRLRLDPATGRGSIHVWWSAREAMLAGLDAPLPGSEDDAVDELQSLLDDSIRLRMIADVPLGAFLSGGIDSSVVVARMQALNPGGVRTFTIGFEEPGADESPHAEAVARHLGTRHETRVVTAADALEVVPRLPEIWDEPFSDASQIPTFLVCREARRSLTVVLSGDGGDELFGGYRHYQRMPRLHRRLRRLPMAIRRWLAEQAGFASEDGPGTLARRLSGRGATRLQVLAFGEPLQKIGPFLTANDELDLLHRWMSFWDQVGGRSIVLGVDPLEEGPPPSWRLGGGDARARMRFADSISYLPGDILTKVDRASMAVSLEAREPLLDHRLFEFAARIPSTWQVRGGRSRWLLRRVLYRSVPESLIERPKQGFTPPIEGWIRGPLRAWAEELLSEDRLRREGWLDADRVGRAWRGFAERRPGASMTRIWTALCFQAWSERWK